MSGARAAPLILLTLAACAGPGAPLEETLTGAPPPMRRGLSAPPAAGLTPPQAVFDQAQSGSAADQAAARAWLQAARREAALSPEAARAAAAPERVVFLDLPPEVAFAAPAPGLALAAPPIAGLPEGPAAAVRAGLISGLGGAVRKETAATAPRRLVALGAAEVRGAAAILRLRLIDGAGAPLGAVAAEAPIADERGWAALGRRGAEKLLAAPALAAALKEGAAIAAPRLPSPQADPTASGQEKTVALIGVSGGPGGADRALTAAMAAALKERGYVLSETGRPRHRISARVVLRRGPAGDVARIQWIFTRLDGDAERVIGEARQEREGPPGAFDQAWGVLAATAAQDAASAFEDLVQGRL